MLLGAGLLGGVWSRGRLMGRLGRLLGVRRLRGLELRWLRLRLLLIRRLGMGGLGWWLLGVGWRCLHRIAPKTLLMPTAIPSVCPWGREG